MTPSYETLGMTSERFLEALRLALELHKNQIRKTSGAPYASHLLSVCGLVLAHGGNEDEAIAALLHDSLEDHADRFPPDLLKQKFGESVLNLVLECTDTGLDYRGGPKAPWLERKQAFLQDLQNKQLLSHRILLADKTDNLRATVHAYRKMGEEVWTYFRGNREQQLWYFQTFCKIMREKEIKSPLLDEYEDTLTGLLFLMKDVIRAA
jgi:(p)ppGpp synthase/HD superfamily hydrolase